jgi:hypothetical protein
MVRAICISLAFILLGVSCSSSQPCLALDVAPSFSVWHGGGWYSYGPLDSLAVYPDRTIVATSKDNHRCAVLSPEEFVVLNGLARATVQKGLGRPIITEDSRNLGLTVGTVRVSAAYSRSMLTPEGAAFVYRLDLIAQRHFGRFYGHTLTRLRPR